jgi:hypothetical protein
MAIESDVRGADENLYAEFYIKPVKQNFASEEAGRPIFADVVYVKIMTPSDQLTQIDTIAREDHKARFPRQWAYFQNKQAGMQQVVGTPVGEWPQLTASAAEELRAMKFFTVELIANANDGQLQKIGMIAGMSPHSLRDKARAFLNLANDSAEEAKREAELEALRQENERLKAETDQKLAEMQEQMKALLLMASEKKPRAKKKVEEVEE